MADKYADHATLGEIPNNAVISALVNPPVMFIAPPEHTVSSGELWIAVSCPDNNYGGCVVWMSNTGSEYREIKRLEGQAVVGKLSAPLPAATGADLINTLSVDFSSTLSSHLIDTTLLESVGTADFLRGEPLCYVGGELLVFKNATLTNVGQYNLSNLKRGLFKSTAGALTNDPFVLLKDGIFRYKFNQQAVGGTLYFKFQAFNTVGSGMQDLADCVAYQIILDKNGGVKALISNIPIYTAGDNIAIVDNVISAIIPTISKPIIPIISTSFMVGTTPTLVASMTLPASTYPAPTAEFGCGNPAKAATLELRKKDGTVLCTLGGVAGGVDWHTADAGFTLVAATAGDLVLYTNAAAEPAFITSFNF